MKRTIQQILKFALLSLVMLYAADWLVLRVRISRQSGLSTVHVDQFLGTRLKGNKEEYDYLGSQEQPCVESVFPHASNPPCWWVEQHKTQWIQ